MPPPRFRIPPPPPGLPRRWRPWYLAAAAILSAVIAVLPACPVQDAAGRPVWRIDTIHDGDTVTCIDTAGKPQKIRLLGIDAPEFDQPYGRLSRDGLAKKISRRGVRVEGTARDQYGRLLGTLWIEDRDVNREMVVEGLAWVFDGFAADPDLVAAETAARRAHRGLWADPHPMAPSQWRSEHPAHR